MGKLREIYGTTLGRLVCYYINIEKLYIIPLIIPFKLGTYIYVCVFFNAKEVLGMVKKWIDANEITKTNDLDEKLWKYESLMQEVPKHKNHGARKIFQRKEYAIYKVKEGYIIHNTNKKFENGHSHVRSFIKAKSLIDLSIRRKLPNSNRGWEIETLLRISNDMTYKNKLRDL